MRFHDPSFSGNIAIAVAFLLVSSSFLLTAAEQEPPKPPAPSEQSASNVPLPVIKTESRIVLVDAVVTDKKGNYLHDLTQQDFRVYEDNKEQEIVSLSFGSEALTEAHRGQKHYIVLFFDNSSMGRRSLTSCCLPAIVRRVPAMGDGIRSREDFSR